MITKLFLFLALAAFLLALALYASPKALRKAAIRSLAGFVCNLQMVFQTRHIVLANTYDAALEVHSDTLRRTNDAAVTARHLLWKQGSTVNAVALCGATDQPQGTIDNTETATGVGLTVLLLGKGMTKKVVAALAITAGDRVYTAASGKVTNVPAPGCYYIGQALTTCANADELIELLDNRPVKITGEVSGAYNVFAAGVHPWAGGTATTDSISVVGLLSTDIVICTLTARAASEALVLAANDDSNDQIDLTLSANGTNTTTKVNYLVLRPIA